MFTVLVHFIILWVTSSQDRRWNSTIVCLNSWEKEQTKTQRWTMREAQRIMLTENFQHPAIHRTGRWSHFLEQHQLYQFVYMGNLTTFFYTEHLVYSSVNQNQMSAIDASVCECEQWDRIKTFLKEELFIFYQTEGCLVLNSSHWQLANSAAALQHIKLICSRDRKNVSHQKNERAKES